VGPLRCGRKGPFRVLIDSYRVNSRKGTQFRVWTNQILREYLHQGYALNEVRFEQQLELIERLKKRSRLEFRELKSNL